MDKDKALRAMVGTARAYVLVTRDLEARCWEMERAELDLDRATVRALRAGATMGEITRVTAAVAALMETAA